MPTLHVIGNARIFGHSLSGKTVISLHALHVFLVSIILLDVWPPTLAAFSLEMRISHVERPKTARIKAKSTKLCLLFVFILFSFHPLFAITFPMYFLNWFFCVLACKMFAYVKHQQYEFPTVNLLCIGFDGIISICAMPRIVPCALGVYCLSFLVLFCHCLSFMSSALDAVHNNGSCIRRRNTSTGE